MPDSTWNNLETVVLTGSVEDLRSASLPVTAGALVVDCGEPYAALLVLLPRTKAPVILLADTDVAGAASLVAAGADDVLARSAPFAEVMRAARHAVARRRQQAGGAGRVIATPPQTAPTQSTVITGRDSREVAESSGARPRDTGPAEMPPQLQVAGRLAGGVAHDFNNLLQVIGGSAEGLVHELEAGDPRREAAQAIVDASRRAATLTQQLLAFGRRQTLIASPIDISALITEALPQLRGRVGQRVKVTTRLAADLPPVHADRSQVLEVLSNLADNAAEAMPEGGTLAISSGMVEVDEEMRRARPWLHLGPFIRIQLTDTGAGIEDQALPHLFEPFFSTKSQWGRTGLGLASVYGVIKQSGGFIWVESKVGQGTRVTILLPPVVEVAAPVPVEKVQRGRVVLVEDDEGVRELLAGVLAHYGYEVVAYPNAEDALGHTAAFDLLLSDVLLPGMKGPDLAREMRRKHPGVPVLLMSGDTGHVVDPKELDVKGFLQKPFSARTLVARVEELIANPKPKKRTP
ncbi:MAG: ATP-binding protein [Vicinamibacterales bacterium]